MGAGDTSDALSFDLDLSFSTHERRWQAILDRNVLANGKFLVGVNSTKVFCRPICPARLPNRKNVMFFKDVDEAIAAGFRACKRCRPESESASLGSCRTRIVTNACRTMEQDPKVTLTQLAQQSKLSKFHFQRIFKSIMGITPQQYKMTLRSGETDGKKIKKVVFAVGACYLGHILVAVSDRGICAIELGDDADELVRKIQQRFPTAEFSANHPHFDNLVSILGGTAESLRLLEWNLPLDIQGTAFQCRVWQSLREIPWGESRTYTDIANNIGSPAAVRAVAKACASNPLAIAIPCHRVVRTNQALAGYRWGLEKKKALREFEESSPEDNSGYEEFKAWVENCIA